MFEEIAVVRRMAEIEKLFSGLFQGIPNSILRACKIVREWITDDDRRKPICLVDRLVNRLASQNLADDLDMILTLIPSSPIQVTGPANHGAFWRAIVSQLVFVVCETLLDVVILLSVLAKGSVDPLVSQMLESFQGMMGAPIQYLNSLGKLPTRDFFNGRFIPEEVGETA
jgi:hypothetical protein